MRMRLITFQHKILIPIIKQRSQNLLNMQAQNLANGKPKNAGLAWTKELKQEVAQLFEQGKSTKELAKYFERTDGSIRSELKHQGLIE